VIIKKLIIKLLGGWIHIFTFLGRYWKAYGGLPKLLVSPYFHAAILLTYLSKSAWLNGEWWELIIAIHPAIIGFSIAALGFIISFGLGGGGFTRILCRTSKEEEDELLSPIMTYGATFTHFILVQFVALTGAVSAKLCIDEAAPDFAMFLSHPFVVHGFWAVVVFFGIYSLFMILAVCEMLFTLLRLSVRFQKRTAAREREDYNSDR
jgi:hypothetical protein